VNEIPFSLQHVNQVTFKDPPICMSSARFTRPPSLKCNTLIQIGESQLRIFQRCRFCSFVISHCQHLTLFASAYSQLHACMVHIQETYFLPQVKQKIYATSSLYCIKLTYATTHSQQIRCSGAESTSVRGLLPFQYMRPLLVFNSLIIYK
jgi:hypothetical protein